MQSHKTFIVTTSADRPLASIAEDLSALGLTVDQLLAEIGVIIVIGDDTAAQGIRAIPGVSDVAPAMDIDIGPPDAPYS
jgi:hypothetical protein